MDNFAKVNVIYSKYFNSGDKPARSTVAVKTLPKNAKVEIECIAFVPKQLWNILIIWNKFSSKYKIYKCDCGLCTGIFIKTSNKL